MIRTCKICEKYEIDIGEANSKDDDDESKRNLTNGRTLHLRKAEAGQADIKTWSEASKNDESVHTITFDLQQALPTPKLTTGPAFYKRKVWTYNFNVHNCADNKGHFFSWSEDVASRGSDKICSCLKRYFEDNNIRGDVLIAISDNCGGQNKNWTVEMFWVFLIASGRFNRVEHHFPLSGHSMLPSDRDFARVEVYAKRNCQFVYSPDQWLDVVSKSCQNFVVYKMKRHHFKTFDILTKVITKRTRGTEGENVKFKENVRFVFHKNNLDKMNCSLSYNNGIFTVVNLAKRGKPMCASTFPTSDDFFPLKYKKRGLDPSKVDDVLSLLLYIPPAYHQFYEQLIIRTRKEKVTAQWNRILMTILETMIF